MARRTKNDSIKQARAQFGALSEGDQKELAWWLMFMEDPSRAIRWMESFRSVCDTLAAAPTTEAAAIFWIRLFGVLDEISRDSEPWDYDAVKFAPNPHGTDDERSAWVELTNREREADVHRACQELRREFNEDELLLIQWKRDDEAHVFLKGYELQAQNGRLVGSRDTAILGSVEIERVRRIALDHENARADTATAVDFAQRAKPYVERMIAAMKSFEMF